MKNISALNDTTSDVENRATLIPADVATLCDLGFQVSIESGMGLMCHYSDESYSAVGAIIKKQREELLENANLVLRLNKPEVHEVSLLQKNSIHISFLDPFNNHEVVLEFLKKQVSSIGLELIPRTTISQNMDVLSSQASLSGYVAAVLGAERLNKAFPMMITPAGTISPARVFIVGAGVAGLQAIATAKRLGANVEAYDTRQAALEQIKSLGARAVEFDLGQTGQTAGGYAKELTQEQLEKQRLLMAEQCALCDVVITTAQVFGKRAPILLNNEMLSAMKPGSVVIDLAVESGGNVEASVINKEIDFKGIKVIGLQNLPGKVSVHASQMLSKNLINIVRHLYDYKRGEFNININDEILKGCLVTHECTVINEELKKQMGRR